MMNLCKTALTAIVLTSFLTFGSGCGEEVVEAPKPVVKAPKRKPKPTKTIDVLMTELSIDSRIYVNEEEAPKDVQARIAILKFFDAMLKVNTAKLKPMLGEDEKDEGEDNKVESDKMQLDAMARNGLQEKMDEVSFVDVKIGTSSDGRQCVMAVYEIGMDYQVQVWYFAKSSDGFTFTSESTPPNLAGQLRGDWMTHFFELKDEMIEIANQPDDDTSYTIFGSSSEGDSESTGQGRPRPNPGGRPGGAPKAPGGPLE
jgi:hypothetical protein